MLLKRRKSFKDRTRLQILNVDLAYNDLQRVTCQPKGETYLGKYRGYSRRWCKYSIIWRLPFGSAWGCGLA